MSCNTDIEKAEQHFRETSMVSEDIDSKIGLFGNLEKISANIDNDKYLPFTKNHSFLNSIRSDIAALNKVIENMERNTPLDIVKDFPVGVNGTFFVPLNKEQKKHIKNLAMLYESKAEMVAKERIARQINSEYRKTTFINELDKFLDDVMLSSKLNVCPHPEAFKELLKRFMVNAAYLKNFPFNSPDTGFVDDDSLLDNNAFTSLQLDEVCDKDLLKMTVYLARNIRSLSDKNIKKEDGAYGTPRSHYLSKDVDNQRQLNSFVNEVSDQLKRYADKNNQRENGNIETFLVSNPKIKVLTDKSRDIVFNLLKKAFVA